MATLSSATPGVEAPSKRRVDSTAKSQPAAKPKSIVERYVRTPDIDDPTGDLYAQAIEHLRRDSGARAHSLIAMRESPQGYERKRILQLLAAVHTPDILEAAVELTRDAAATRRHDGYALMQLSATKVARDTLAQAIMEETDPAALASAIEAFQAQTALPASLVETVTARLEPLTKHPAEEVRAAALATLRMLDPHRAAETLVRGLADKSPSVNEAAITSLGDTTAHSEELTSELLGLATDSQAPIELRSRAADAVLERDVSADDQAMVERFKATLGFAAP